MSKVEVGSRAKVGGKLGTVRFIGTTSFGAGEWVGVELDTPEGKNDGTTNGVVYFDCKDNHGLFVRKIQVKLFDENARSVTSSRMSSVGTTQSRRSSISSASSTAASASAVKSTLSTRNSSSRLSMGGKDTSSTGSTSKTSTSSSTTTKASTRSTRTSSRLSISGKSKACETDNSSVENDGTKKKLLKTSKTSKTKSDKEGDEQTEEVETNNEEEEEVIQNDGRDIEKEKIDSSVDDTPVKKKDDEAAIIPSPSSLSSPHTLTSSSSSSSSSSPSSSKASPNELKVENKELESPMVAESDKLTSNNKVEKLEAEVSKLNLLLLQSNELLENERKKTMQAQANTNLATKAAKEAKEAALQAKLTANRALEGAEKSTQEVIEIKKLEKINNQQIKQEFELKTKEIVSENSEYKIKLKELNDLYDSVMSENTKLNSNISENIKELNELKYENKKYKEKHLLSSSNNSDDDDSDNDDGTKSIMNKSMNRSVNLDVTISDISNNLMNNQENVNLKDELKIMKSNLTSSELECNKLKNKYHDIELKLQEKMEFINKFELDYEELELTKLELEIEVENLSEMLEQERSISSGGDYSNNNNSKPSHLSSFSSLYGGSGNNGNDEDEENKDENKDHIIGQLKNEIKHHELLLYKLDSNYKKMILKLQSEKNTLSNELFEYENKNEIYEEMSIQYQTIEEQLESALMRLELLSREESQYEVYIEDKLELESMITNLKGELYEARLIIDESDEYRELLEETEEELAETVKLISIQCEDAEALNRDYASELTLAKHKIEELNTKMTKTEQTLVSTRKRRDEALIALASAQEHTSNKDTFDDGIFGVCRPDDKSKGGSHLDTKYERNIDVLTLDLVETKTRLNRFNMMLTPQLMSKIQTSSLNQENTNKASSIPNTQIVVSKSNNDELNELSNLEAEIMTTRCLTKIENIINKWFNHFQQCFELTLYYINEKTKLILNLNTQINNKKEQDILLKKKQSQMLKAKSSFSSSKSSESSTCLTCEDVMKMKVAQLRSELLSRNLSSSGLKADLIARLSQDIKKKEEEEEEEEGNADDVDEAETGNEEVEVDKTTDNVQSISEENLSSSLNINEMMTLYENKVEEISTLTKKQCDLFNEWKDVFNHYFPNLILGAVSLRKLLHITCSKTSAEKPITIAECMGELHRFEESINLIESNVWSESSQTKAPNLKLDISPDKLKGALISLEKAEHFIYDKFIASSMDKKDAHPASYESLISLNMLKQQVALIAIKISKEMPSHQNISFSSSFIAFNNDILNKFDSVLSLYKEVDRFHQICEGTKDEGGVKGTSLSNLNLSSLNHSFTQCQLSPMSTVMADVITTLVQSITPTTTTEVVLNSESDPSVSISEGEDKDTLSAQGLDSMICHLNHARQVCLTSINNVQNSTTSFKACDRLFDTSSAWKAISPPPMTTTTASNDKASSSSSNTLSIVSTPIGERCLTISNALISIVSNGHKLEEMKYTLSKTLGEKLSQERELRSALVTRDRYAEQLNKLEEQQFNGVEEKQRDDLNNGISSNGGSSLAELKSMKLQEIVNALPQVKEMYEQFTIINNENNRLKMIEFNDEVNTVNTIMNTSKGGNTIASEGNPSRVNTIDYDLSVESALRRARTESATWKRRACKSLMSGIRPLPSLNDKSRLQTPIALQQHLQEVEQKTIKNDSYVSNELNLLSRKVHELECEAMKTAADVRVVSLQYGSSIHQPLDLESPPINNTLLAESQIIGMSTNMLQLKEQCENLNYEFSKLYFMRNKISGNKFNVHNKHNKYFKSKDINESIPVGRLVLSGGTGDRGGKISVVKSDLKRLAQALV